MAASIDYQVKAVRTEGGMRQLENDWYRLLSCSQSGSIFASFPWNFGWWRAFGRGNSLYLLAASDLAGQVRGIAPLMMSHAGGIRKLQFIGTGLSDTGDFVLDNGCAGDVARSIFAYLRRYRAKWDLLDLDEVPSYSTLAAYLENNQPDGLHKLQLPRTDCPYIALPSTWEEYIRTLQRKPRQHLEAFARRVIDETGARFQLVMDVQDVQAAVARFYRLHLARWSSKEDLLNPAHRSASFLPFLQEVCERSATSGYLRLAELCVGEDVIASWISFQVNGRWNGYMTGFDPAWSARRPGKLLHGFVVRRAIAEQARELDFGRGAEEYKYEMGAINRQNRRLILSNNMPSSALALGLFNLRLRGRGLVHRYKSGSPSRSA